MRIIIAFGFCAVMCAGCVSGHQHFYRQSAPKAFERTTDLRIFGYANTDLGDIYRSFFSDFLIIGRSKFNGPYESPKQLERFAKSIGADAVLLSVAYTGTRNVTSHVAVPDFE